MRLPIVHGLLDRRILINYRVDPAVLAKLLPSPFRPKLVRGAGLAGICLIRLRGIRPQGLPGWLGCRSENAAQRIAVEWDDGGFMCEGVFVLRRDTNSPLNVMLGGRIFPGVHRRARFNVAETDNRFDITIHSADGRADLHVQAQRSARFPTTSVFASLSEASAFFRKGSIGFSPSADASCCEGLEMRCRDWAVESVDIDEVHSRFFHDPTIFPPGTIALDCALLMRGIEHEWHSVAAMRKPEQGHGSAGRSLAMTS